MYSETTGETAGKNSPICGTSEAYLLGYGQEPLARDVAQGCF